MTEEKTYPIRVFEISSEENKEGVSDNAKFGSPQIINVSKSGYLYHPVPSTELNDGVDIKDTESPASNGLANESHTQRVNDNQCRSSRAGQGRSRDVSKADLMDSSGWTSNLTSGKGSSIDSEQATSKKGRKKVTTSGRPSENSSLSSWNCLKGNADRHGSESESCDELADLKSVNNSPQSLNDWRISSESYQSIDRRNRTISEASVMEGLMRLEAANRLEADKQGFVFVELGDVPDKEHALTKSEQTRRKRGFCTIL